MRRGLCVYIIILYKYDYIILCRVGTMGVKVYFSQHQIVPSLEQYDRCYILYGLSRMSEIAMKLSCTIKYYHAIVAVKLCT